MLPFDQRLAVLGRGADGGPGAVWRGVVNAAQAVLDSTNSNHQRGHV